jgi:hypothetical protein
VSEHEFKPGDRVRDKDFGRLPEMNGTVIEVGDGVVDVRFDSGEGSEPEGIAYPASILEPLPPSEDPKLVTTDEGERVNTAGPYVDIVFDGPPGPYGCRFIEVEDSNRKSIRFGRWVHRDDGYWGLRIDAASSTCPNCGKAAPPGQIPGAQARGVEGASEP